MIPVGIDDLNLYASTLVIDFSDIVAARKIPGKDFQHVRFMSRSVLPAFEDPVTLAVNAAKPIVDAAGPDDFELLIVATETGVDYGKPLSSYAHKYLGLGHFCRNFEIKHACYAGTAAFQTAISWVRSGIAPGKKALVIMTDIGRKHFNESAELSVGAGAVALSVSSEPRVFALETPVGYASQEVYDTSRPTSTFEWIDPVLSLSSYLDLLEIAWNKYRHSAGPISFKQHFGYMVYHLPLMSLIERAHQLLVEGDDENAAEDEVAASFERMVIPSLRYNRIIGNIYSGSLYVALAGLLEAAPKVARESRVGCFSYGSGACAEFFSGLIGQEAQAVLAAHQIGQKLAARRRVSLAEYEAAILAVEHSLGAANFEPDWTMPSGHFEAAYQDRGLLVLDRVDHYYRTYKSS
jgi:3-hydroxy-3-methylglutaryl CoA synthase